VVDILDLRLLLDPVYVNIAIGTGISLFADFTYCALYPLFILELGFSMEDSATFISILTAADIFGRLSVTLIGAFSPQVSSRVLFMAGAVTSVAGRTSMSTQIKCQFLQNIRQEKRSLKFRRKVPKLS
jgi:hypothetical protein